MTGGCRRAAVAAVAVVVLSVAQAGATTTPLGRADRTLHALSGKQVVGDAVQAIPCDYNWTDTVVVDAPCAGPCGVDRQYRVNRVVRVWTPGTPKTEEPLNYYKVEWMCTPTDRLVGYSRPKNPAGKPLTCLAIWEPTLPLLCAHSPATVGCGWATAPRLSGAAAAAIKAALPPPSKASITYC